MYSADRGTVVPMPTSLLTMVMTLLRPFPIKFKKVCFRDTFRRSENSTVLLMVTPYSSRC
jgi:hypothetical protein